jgi:hypothetical protein
MIGRAAFDGFSIFKAVVWNTAYFVWHFLAGNNFKPLEPIQWRPAQNLQETNRKQSAIADSTTIVCNFFFCVALSMKTYGRPTGTETAFLQGITSMAEAATRAAVAAERALERATSALQVVVFMMAFREPPAF